MFYHWLAMIAYIDWLLCHAIIIMIYINNINVEKNSICFT
jgi:hypothetical protein